MTDQGNAYRTKFPEPDWRQVAERAAQEKDPKKLAFLIQALCDRLEELQKARHGSLSATPPNTSGTANGDGAHT